MDLISTRYSAGLRTYIITLKFPDLELAADRLEKISYGGDCWEFRVDLLGPPSIAIPPVDYVRQQLRVLQELPRRLPILFTVRTVSQGGRFPDDAAHEALELMKLAVEKGCEYIDVEMSWPSSVIDGILAAKGEAKIVASFHEFDGSIKWTSQAVNDMCAAANAVGGTSSSCPICDARKADRSHQTLSSCASSLWTSMTVSSSASTSATTNRGYPSPLLL